MKCYKCQSQLPESGSVCPACGQQVYTTASSPASSLGRRIDGCLEEAPSPKDYHAVPTLTTIPHTVDLRDHCSPVEDQGRIGSCVACAVVGATEYQHRKAGRPAVDLSRMFVYFNARRMRGTEQHDNGTTIAAGMAAFLAFGAPPEASWPYDPELVTKTPDDPAFQKGLENVPAEYARVDGIENVKGALAQGFPVVFSASVPQRCYEEAGRTGVIPPPTAAEVAEIRTQNGRHALLLVGYDLNDKTFLVRNSWGADWGRQGYCRMSFDTFTATLAANTTWILGKLESGAFTIVRPALTATPVEGGVRDLASKMRDEIRGNLMKDLQDSFKDIKSRVNPPRRDG